MTPLVQKIKERIEGTKYKGLVFVAGGAVRDYVMGNTPKDIDLLINLPNGGLEFARYMSVIFNGKYVEYPRYGVGLFEIDGVDIECVMPRTEVYPEGSRHPEVQFTTLEEDVKRRDFTINSLLWDVSNERVLDLTGNGILDIKTFYINTVGDPVERFTEDPLRLLRAIRFFSRYEDFVFDNNTYKALSTCSEDLHTISKERIQDELLKILVTPHVKRAFDIMYVTGLLDVILPELSEAVGCTQNEHHFEDVFQHSLTVVSKCPLDPIVRLAALLHDIGKPSTRVEHDGKVTFHGHERIGGEITTSILQRLKFSNEIIDKVTKIATNHMRLKQAGPNGTEISDKALRRFIVEMGDDLDDVLTVMHVDNISHAPDSCMTDQIVHIGIRIEQLKKDFEVKHNSINLPINGTDVMLHLGITPGPEVGEKLKIVEEAVLDNPQLTKNEALSLIV